MKITKLLPILFIFSFFLLDKAKADFDECGYITYSCIVGAAADGVVAAASGDSYQCSAITGMRNDIQEAADNYAIFNNRDQDEDGFNDYSMWNKPEFTSYDLQEELHKERTRILEVGQYGQPDTTETYTLADDPKTTRIAVLQAMLSPCGNNPDDYEIDSSVWQGAGLDDIALTAAIEDPEHMLYNYENVGYLPGCIDNGDNTYSGWTYQIYRKEYDSKYSDLCDSSSSILIYDNEYDEVHCIKKGHSKNMPLSTNKSFSGFDDTWDSYELEAEPHAALICAKSILCRSYSLVYPVNGTEDDSEAKIECRDRIGEDECDADGDGFYDEECTETNIEFHYSGSCTLCIDRADCLDSDGYYDADNCDEEPEVCGKYYNKRYLAHCVMDEASASEIISGSVVPNFISSYCTGVATYASSSAVAFVGRIMRCVEYTMNNVMFGSSEVVEDGELKYIKCNDTGQAVDYQSQCKSGMLQKFQIGIKGLVTTLMILSVTLIGFNVLLGAGGDHKQILKQVFVFGLVGYFSVGDAWRDGYYLALQTMGSELGTVLLNAADYGTVEGIADSEGNIVYNVQIDKCKYDDVEFKGPYSIEYPEVRDRHYSVWDVYDCKFKNFIESDNIVPKSGATYQHIIENSIFSFVTFLFPIALGATISFFLIYLSFKVAFYAVTSFMALMILLFISPAIVPLVMFKNKKVRGIFDEWLSHIIGYSLVPLILMALVCITFLVFDYALYGTAGDVLFLDDNGNIKVADNCYNSYLPCLYHKLAEGDYKATKSILGIKFSLFPDEFFVHYLLAVLRLFLMVVVMIEVFDTAVKQLVEHVLGVSLAKENILNSMVSVLGKAASYGGNIAVGGGRRAASMAGAVKRKMTGKGDGGYGA